MCATLYFLQIIYEHTESDVKADHDTQIANVVEACLDRLLMVHRQIAKHDEKKDLLHL